MISAFNTTVITNITSAHTCLPCFDGAWSAFSPTLSTMVTRLVYASRVPTWYGQEDEIAADIVQEAARRLLERLRKAERREADPIQCFERMAVATAFNYCR